MPEVPNELEIGGNLVENWCQIGEKVGDYQPSAVIFLVSLIRTRHYGVRLISNLLELGWFKINFSAMRLKTPRKKDFYRQ